MKPAIAALAAVVLAPTALAIAAAPKSATLTLDAQPTVIVYSGVATLSGRLTDPAAGKADGVTVRLEEDATRPYGDAYTATGATAKTAANGKYSFARKPLTNTQYRVVAATSGTPTSGPRLVLVRPRVGLKVEPTSTRAGGLVRFSGSVYPALDGRSALIQRRSSTGRFVTVARTTLRDAGTARSSYSRSVRVNRDGAYRVKVTGDANHINGFSRTRTIDVA